MSRSVRLAILALSLGAFSAHARIYLDYEVDPLPVLDINVVIPAGFEAREAADAGAVNLLADIFENGTARLTRQELVDAYGRFGATVDFSTSNQHSVLKLSLPVVEGMNYESFIALAAENWHQPRFTEDSFKLARLKLEGALRSSLDSDMALGAATIRRWANRHYFGGFPVTLDALAKLDLARTRAAWESEFLGVPDVWVGVVGPEASRPLVKELLSKIFTRQGDIKEGHLLEPLKIREAKAQGLKAGDKTFLLIEKPGRTQSVFTVLSVTDNKLDDRKEVAFQFANHILVDSGLGSVFGEEIRTRRGLAYSVGGVQRYYLGYPSLGLAANPLRVKANEALAVTAKLLQDAYETGETFAKLPEDAWKRQWQSFTYGHILDTSAPSGRLAERTAVVTGALSRRTFESDPTDWKVSRDDAADSMRSIWKKSALLASVLGDAKELRPMLEKHFPDWKIVVIPYADTLKAATYDVK